MLALEPVEPVALVSAVQIRRGVLGEREEVFGLSVSGLADRTVGRGSFDGECPDCLEHPQAWRAVGVFAAAQQALLGEWDQLLFGPGAPDRFGRINPHSADERR